MSFSGSRGRPEASTNARPRGAFFPGAVVAAVAALIAGCGGGSGQSTAAGQSAARAHAQDSGNEGRFDGAGTTHADAFRLLTQASFGPTDADIANVMASGVEGWVDQQEALPLRYSFLQRWNSDNALLQGVGGAATANVDSAIYQAALQSDDQLRQRVTFALSEIFVVSMLDNGLSSAKSQTAASFYDTLQRDAFGNFRTLLQDVTLHPAMGQYLSALGNPLENPRIGRIPDQNFAREVMQLFTIGLVQLSIDGTPKLDDNGAPLYTYGPADIDGLSRVFTGWSWAGPDKAKQRFYSNPSWRAPDRLFDPMQDYPDFHSLSEKDFLGTVIPASQVPDAPGNLKIALDTLFSHPNVGPFISKQLIQRLVTSNPSSAYVARVATVFNNDGTGTRGNLGAVVKAILTDAEARDPALAQTPAFGKLREPVLRMTAFLRAYHATSDSGLMLIGATDDPGAALSQSPLRSPTVFNFFRPAYVNAGGQTAEMGLVAPEMQITNESSVAGYAYFMQAALAHGLGMRGLTGHATRNDVQPDLTAAVGLANDSSVLVPDVCARLIGDTVDAALVTQIRTAVDSVRVPDWNKDHSNGQQIARALSNRAQIAVLLALASPEYIAQK